MPSVLPPSSEAARVPILVLGAGYAGLSAALTLRHRLGNGGRSKILLLDRQDHHLLETRLQEAATRDIPITVPLRNLLRGTSIRFRQAGVRRVDLDRKIVRLQGGGALGYDCLIIALGSRTNYFGIPGLESHAFPLKAAEDSRRIRTHLEACFAKAAQEPSERRRRKAMRVVIGGAGPTGVELAGEMADRVTDLCLNHRLNPDEAEVVLIEAASNPLPGASAAMSTWARASLEATGIALWMDCRVVGVRDGLISLSDGTRLSAATFIWTGGVRAADGIVGRKARFDVQGRIEVDAYLQVVGYPEAWAAGDMARVLDPATNQPVPPYAQFAVRQGECAGTNAAAVLSGKPRRRYRHRVLGEVVSLGPYDGVGWVSMGTPLRRPVEGLEAAAFKRLIRGKYRLGLRAPRGPIHARKRRSD